MSPKAFNFQIFLESFCSLFLGGVLLYLVSSGKYLSYVTPRMKPYLYFTVIVLFLWVVWSMRRIFRPQHKVRTMHCFVLVIPILLFLLPHGSLSTADFSANYAGGNILKPGSITFDAQTSTDKSKTISLQPPVSASSARDAADASSVIQKAETSSPSAFSSDGISTSPPVEAPSSMPQTDALTSDSVNSSSPATQAALPNSAAVQLTGLDLQNKKIAVSNTEFYPWLVEICMNVEKYEGYTVSITGFIFNDPEYLNPNEFIPARLSMTCCTADLAPIGLICKYSNASELSAGTWVTVEGTLHKGQYNGQDEPQVTVSKIIPAEEVEGYIYPSL